MVEVTGSVASELLGELEPADRLELHDLPLKGWLESDVEVAQVPQVVEVLGRGHLEAPRSLRGCHLDGVLAASKNSKTYERNNICRCLKLFSFGRNQIEVFQELKQINKKIARSLKPI